MIKTSRSLRARLGAAALVLGAVGVGVAPGAMAADDVLSAFYAWVDADGDQRITPAEVEAVDGPRAPQACAAAVSSSRWLQLRSRVMSMTFQELDADGDGAISPDEVEGLGGMFVSLAEGSLLDADRDADGRIGEDELAAEIALRWGDAGTCGALARMAPLLAHGVVMQYDRDGDRRLDPSEAPVAG